MKLHVTHHTHYDYSPPVEAAQHVACLRPRTHRQQQVIQHTLSLSPTPSLRNEQEDAFGNQRCFFAFQTQHATLDVTAVSEVITQPPPAAVSSCSWESVRERFRYQVGASYDPAVQFVYPSPHIVRHDEFATYARPSFSQGAPLLEAAKDLMARIHADFTYASQSTEISTPALQALAQRSGVCQDFAHILIACLRTLGLPARYVSGYLLTHPPEGQPRLIGSDASHAWVSVYLPDLPGAQDGHGWYDLDPTNNRDGWGSPGQDYVRLAIGRDYSDISPLRGVIHGGANHTLRVAVTVMPVDEP